MPALLINETLNQRPSSTQQNGKENQNEFSKFSTRIAIKKIECSVAARVLEDNLCFIFDII